MLYPDYVVAICVLITLLCTLWIPIGALTHFFFKWPDTSRLVGSDSPEGDNYASNDYSEKYGKSLPVEGKSNEGFEEIDLGPSHSENYLYKKDYSKNGFVNIYEAEDFL